jgi:hypothetical protein
MPTWGYFDLDPRAVTGASEGYPPMQHSFEDYASINTGLM